MGRLYRYFALASLFFEAEVHCAGAVCHEGLKRGVTALSALDIFLFFVLPSAHLGKHTRMCESAAEEGRWELHSKGSHISFR